jgi:hypothetical protein
MDPDPDPGGPKHVDRVDPDPDSDPDSDPDPQHCYWLFNLQEENKSNEPLIFSLFTLLFDQ